jgi:diguanylate cyclase
MDAHSDIKKEISAVDAKQTLRFKRHLTGMAAALIYTLISAYLFYDGYFRISSEYYATLLAIYWLGNLCCSFAIIKGFNLRFSDPSLTLFQLSWSVLFMLLTLYLINDMRSVILMAFFAAMSFGNFRLSFVQFSTIAAFAILGYLFVIVTLYINEPLRLNLEREFTQLICFALTVSILVYTGSAVSRLRENNRRQTEKLEAALELNTRLATTDDLTGLSTRRNFMEVLTNQKAHSARESTDFVVCFADLDHFKNINDNFGHHIGDKVLIIFAEIIKSSIREIDYACRFGGEEFVILLVNTDLDKATKVAERIRSILENYNFNDIVPGLKVTVSIGLTNYLAFNSIQETLMSADNKMYRAKEKGRNLVVAD